MANSKAWAHINGNWPDFASNPHNLRLGLTLDGVNHFGQQSTTWSTWPVLALNYNLLSWFTTRKFFIMLVLLILGKEFIKNNNIDVYMVLLLEELLEFWKMVHAWDVTKPIRERMFTLHALLMWSIHDLPTYGLLSG